MRNAFKILQLKTLTNFLNKEVDEKTEVDNSTADSESSTYSASKLYTRDEIDALIDGIGGGGISLSDVYPIGCIYTEITGTNPNTTFGFGTWVAFGTGKVLVGLDSGDASFDTEEETGGSKTVTASAHSGTAVANHSSHYHNVNITPTTYQSKQPMFTLDPKTGASPKVDGNTSYETSTLTHSVTQPSNHASMDIVQPYIVVHFWKRTA